MTCIALLSKDSRAIVQGQVCLTSLQDLYTYLINPEVTQLTLTKEFTDAYFTDVGLQEFVDSVAQFNPKCEVITEVELAVDEHRAVSRLLRIGYEELSYLLVAKPKRVMSLIRKLCKNYLSARADALVASNKISMLQLQNAELIANYEQVSSALDLRTRQYTQVASTLQQVVAKVNYSYDKPITTDTVFNIEGSSTYSKVLYIKEQSRIRYMDTFLYYLREIIRILYGAPARFLVIAPYYSYEGVKRYPDLKPTYNMTYSDLYSHDLYMPGVQMDVLSNIMRNPSSATYLIVFDTSGGDVPFIQGKDVEYLYTVSDAADNIMNAPWDRLVSYSDKTLYIPHVTGFESMSLEERMQRYSSMNITKKCMELLEAR